MPTNNTDLVGSGFAGPSDTVRLPAVPLDPQAASHVELLSTAPDARDVTAELAAPPRRRLPWLTLVLAGGVIAAAAFSGGAWYQKNHGDSSGGGNRAAAAGQRGAQGAAPGAQGAGGSRRGGATGGSAAGGQQGQPGFTRGTVKLVDGSTVYLTDANGNIVKVTTGDSTKVSVTQDGKVGDLKPGQSVTVVGTPDGSGGYSAAQLTEGGAAGGGFGGFGGAAGGQGGGVSTKSGG
jgi:hypothetical protein